ncbi:E3 ubiquitin-protein ligase MARCHF5-like [Stigmatopora nigra]
MAALLDEDQPEKHCWVCFATESDDHSAQWLSPCRCRGCTKWIHQSCLQRWLDEKQRGIGGDGDGGGAGVCCPQCGTRYHVVFPKMGPLVFFLQQVDRALSRASPFAAMGALVGTAYWSAVTYGAVAVMQVLGHKKGLNMMERADPIFLLVGLPAIPVVLVLGKMVRWEDVLVRFWLRISCHRQHAVSNDLRPLPGAPGDHLSVSRTLCGALVLPWISSMLGRLLFRGVTSNLRQALLGGATFVLLKGSLKVYVKHQQHIMQTKRNILDYPDTRDTATSP